MSASLTPLFAVAGTALVSHLVGDVLEEVGKGKYKLFLQIGTYVICMYITFNLWWDAVRYVARTFGVFL
ncbi:hypothetical protein [Chengkuizengella marina]|uniref:Uncharacterized protein n=1 Tax=Chengkuizengella marina TaxID=2507566 RepID=A0A6N9Q260_9BACL|nr:hypothetical protein [Chengkuizengella marina]NBI28620.1 hypothetical protein [Chengkuizengella marina]